LACLHSNDPVMKCPASSARPSPARGLMDAYRARPPYQQNDYIGWITRAKLESTRQKRLAQMLDELEGGTTYMKMKWHPK